jgi:hypothetical protein
MYDNKRKKPVEIVLRRGRGKEGMMENDLRYIVNTCKYHNVFLCITIICQ